MKSISQEGANHIEQQIDGIVDSMTKKLTGPQVKKVQDELSSLVQLWKSIQDTWSKTPDTEPSNV
jgi:flagellin-specific chaperone FliS